MALIQQREILMKLQEEAEARGEHFDIQEYLAQLAEQSEEEDELGKQDNKSDKLNKSFWFEKSIIEIKSINNILFNKLYLL